MGSCCLKQSKPVSKSLKVPLTNETNEETTSQTLISSDNESKINEPQMKALVVTKQIKNSCSGISYGKQKIPSILKNNEILIKVYYSSINPIDYKLAELYMDSFKRPTPYIFGYDFSGIITKLGPNVDENKFKIGDKVCGQTRLGSFAEYAVAIDKCCAVLDNDTNLRDIAGLPLAGTTSYGVLYHKDIMIQQSDKLLILGGSTATGIIATQLAKNIGCQTITVTSSSEQFCKDLGATKVINYKQDKWETILDGNEYDIIYDTCGENDGYNKSKNVLKKNGKYISIAKYGKKENDDDPEFIFYLNKPEIGLKSLVKQFENGSLKVVIDEEYELKDFMKMIEKCKSGKAKGKLIACWNKEEVSNVTDDDNKEEE